MRLGDVTGFLQRASIEYNSVQLFTHSENSYAERDETIRLPHLCDGAVERSQPMSINEAMLKLCLWSKSLLTACRNKLKKWET